MQFPLSHTGRTWEFQLCSDLIVRTGFSAESMFIEREWTLEWLADHCESRGFGVEPQPYRLVDQWGFNDLVGNGASRILFTNGLNDGWSVLSILEDLSDTLVTLNFPNGAHHSVRLVLLSCLSRSCDLVMDLSYLPVTLYAGPKPRWTKRKRHGGHQAWIHSNCRNPWRLA